MALDDRGPDKVNLTQGGCEEAVECGRSVFVRKLWGLLSGDHEDARMDAQPVAALIRSCRIFIGYCGARRGTPCAGPPQGSCERRGTSAACL